MGDSPNVVLHEDICQEQYEYLIMFDTKIYQHRALVRFGDGFNGAKIPDFFPEFGNIFQSFGP